MGFCIPYIRIYIYHYCDGGLCSTLKKKLCYIALKVVLGS